MQAQEQEKRERRRSGQAGESLRGEGASKDKHRLERIRSMWARYISAGRDGRGMRWELLTVAVKEIMLVAGGGVLCPPGNY